MSLKSVIKRKINTGKPIDANILISNIKDYEIVSFDVFDTLLKRNVKNPSDVFSYVGKSIDDPKFVEKRLLAEKNARNKKIGAEITLKDIYKEFGIDFSREELEAESELLIVNDDILPVFKYCIENKRVILISDMYLPEDFICSILHREGLVGYEKIYISSSLNKTKSNGDLFEFVINDLRVNEDKIIHIGDSIKSDYKKPNSIGMSSIHIPTHIVKAKYQMETNSIEGNILNNFINNTIPINCDEYYRFGYEKFGMFLWGFSKWLYESVIDAGINKLYFFSRDGLIMKNAFDSLYADVETHYLEVSRRALRVPVLWLNYNFEHVLDMISPSKLVPISTIFDGVGLNIDDYQELITQYGFSCDTCFDRNELLDNDQLMSMYKKLGADIERVSKHEYEILVKYLKQNNMKGKFAIVDIGWSGGMQRYLCETLEELGIEKEIKGFYIGVADYYKRNKAVIPLLDLNGYLFDFSHDSDAVDRRSPFVGLFETLFLEQDGSVKNYKEECGVVKGNRLEYEYIQNGNPTYELQCVKRIQDGALDFVRRFGVRNISLSSEELFKGVEQTGLRPTKKDIEMFADFRFFDEGETHCLAKPKSVFRYIFHINELKKDFLMSRWKIGFMKRLFKISLPYERIYRGLLNYK